MGIARKGRGVSTLARMVWGNFLGRICLVLGGSRMVRGTFFGDEVSQSARLTAGRGVQKLFRQFPNAFGMNLNGASLTLDEVILYPK